MCLLLRPYPHQLPLCPGHFLPGIQFGCRPSSGDQGSTQTAITTVGGLSTSISGSRPHPGPLPYCLREQRSLPRRCLSALGLLMAHSPWFRYRCHVPFRPRRLTPSLREVTSAIPPYPASPLCFQTLARQPTRNGLLLAQRSLR